MPRKPRREFLTLGTLDAGGALLMPRLSFARAAPGKSRLVVIILRGALDGLAAVPPYGDPDYPRLRGDLALRAGGGPGGALTLDGYFGLHPALGFLHDSFAARELIVFHAVASPYRERSHFDGQDLLENGTSRAHAVQTGWLNRALGETPAAGAREAGVALGQNVPLLMRGPAAVTSWSPSIIHSGPDCGPERLSRWRRSLCSAAAFTSTGSPTSRTGWGAASQDRRRSTSCAAPISGLSAS